MPAYFAYIGLGSNLSDPLTQVLSAYSALHNLPQTECFALSGLYSSQAVGPGPQPNYINAVAALRTDLSPLLLLDQLQAIERAHKRTRDVHWGPRTLDLDLLLYGDQQIQEPRLTVPHPHMLSRNFVLAPLADIAPQLIMPDGLSVSAHLARCGYQGLQRFRHASTQHHQLL